MNFKHDYFDPHWCRDGFQKISNGEPVTAGNDLPAQLLDLFVQVQRARSSGKMTSGLLHTVGGFLNK